jgi:ankyrin repeat protein
MVAVIYNHLDVARRLIQGGARINPQDNRGATALMIAAKYRRLEIGQLLLDAGADGRIRDDNGKTAAAWVPDGGRDTEQRLRTLLGAAAAK